MIKLFLFSLSLFVLMPISYGGTIDPYIPDIRYINYAKDFNFVGKLCGTYNDGTKFCASAVAIDDHHILTAAHVIQNSDNVIFLLDNKEFCITKIIAHKDFKTEFGVADIAIGYSKESFNLKFYPPLYEDTDETEKICSICGYGITGTFKTGATVSDDKNGLVLIK